MSKNYRKKLNKSINLKFFKFKIESKKKSKYSLILMIKKH